MQIEWMKEILTLGKCIQYTHAFGHHIHQKRVWKPKAINDLI